MNERQLIESLENTAYTTGAGANCFFQGFIHTLCVQEPEVIDGMSRFPGPQKLIEVFNREVPNIKVNNMKDLLIVANAMHPLERELIFGHLMRKTLNELDLKSPEPELMPLTLKDGSIIYPPHAVAFSHAFGFSYDEYTHKNEAGSMPDHLKNDLFENEFYRVRYSLKGAVGTISLRLKSCHFEVGGLTPEQIKSHQSKIKPEVLKSDSNRPEQPGARYYEEPSLGSDCAVKNAKVKFSEALSQTIAALRERPGQHTHLLVAVTEIFIKGLQEATGKNPFPKKFWEDCPEKPTPTFQNALDKYAEYYEKLNPEQQMQMSELFWDKIKRIGTPIIEDFSNEEVKVHFLFPRDNYDHETKKLYISGDFHGFTSSDNARQEMHQKSNTDIMHRSDVMPRDSVVTYNFLQVTPEYQNKSRQQLTGEVLPKSFYLEDITESGNDPLTDFKSDAYARHTDIGRSIFCANVDNNLSGIHLFKDTDWKNLLTEEYPGYLKNLTHKGTYFCDMDNHLREDKNPANDYMKKIWDVSDKENTRTVSVFQAGEGKVDNLIIIHDGVSYMGTGSIERIDALIGEEKIPKNTAVICISQLPGLIEKYKRESPKKFANATDPRPIEYGSRIGDYIKFIDQALKQLGYDGVPAKNRTLIGSSMSGTASLFMILEHEDKFGQAIVQAPTEGTRIILCPLMLERLEEKKSKKEEDLSSRVHLSCGRFETLEYAQNIRLAHTKEVAEILGSNDQALAVDDTGNYGHLPHCWSQELTETLPKLCRKQHELNPLATSLDQSKEHVATNIDSNTVKISESSTKIFMKRGVANKEHKPMKKMATDDFALQPTKSKKAAQEFTRSTDKKRAITTDDSNITYGHKRPGK